MNPAGQSEWQVGVGAAPCKQTSASTLPHLNPTPRAELVGCEASPFGVWEAPRALRTGTHFEAAARPEGYRVQAVRLCAC